MDSEERNHAEAVLDVRYGMRFNEMNECFYRTFDNVCGATTLVFASAAFVSVIGDLKFATATVALLLAIVGVLERIVRPVEKALDHAEFRRRYGVLDGEASALSLSQLDARLKELQATGPNGIRLLALPAYNQNLRSNGFEAYARTEGRLHRFFAMLA